MIIKAPNIVRPGSLALCEVTKENKNKTACQSVFELSVDSGQDQLIEFTLPSLRNRIGCYSQCGA